MNFIQSIIDVLRDKSHRHDTSFERNNINRFMEELKTINYKEAKKNLIRGLDKESKKFVERTLKRVFKIYKSPKRYQGFYTKDEKKLVDKIRKEFFPNIIKHSENDYSYKNYHMPKCHFEMGIFLYDMHMDTLTTLDKIRNKDIIDVGAYIGDSSVILAKYTDKNVLAYEPDTVNYNFIQQTMEINNVHNIIPVKKGLGAKEEKLEIFLNSSGSSFVRPSGEKEIVEVTTLDKEVEEKNLDVGLIKVDIEGFEQEFLKGARRTIEKFKPTLMISIYHNANDFFFIKPMIESWDLGYKFRIQRPFDNMCIMSETVLIAEAE